MTFPRLRKLIERGAVTLHGAYFGVATGELSVLDRATGEFRPVARSDQGETEISDSCITGTCSRASGTVTITSPSETATFIGRSRAFGLPG